jgi:hypothetical protein
VNDISEFFTTIEDIKVHVAECIKSDECYECDDGKYLIKMHNEIIEKGYFSINYNGYEYTYRHHIFNKF